VGHVEETQIASGRLRMTTPPAPVAARFDLRGTPTWITWLDAGPDPRWHGRRLAVSVDWLVVADSSNAISRSPDTGDVVTTEETLQLRLAVVLAGRWPHRAAFRNTRAPMAPEGAPAGFLETGAVSYRSGVGIIAQLARLDDAVASRPVRFLPHALAGIGLVYVLIGGGIWAASVLTFDYDTTSERLRALGAFPWSGLPLLLVFIRRSVRAAGVVVALGAAFQVVLARGSWGLELAYVPLVLVGILLACVGRRGEAQ
jgi:hypothetical protein